MKQKIAYILIAVLIGWITWIPYGRNPEWKESPSELDLKEVIHASPSCDRNVVAIQPYMIPRDYLSDRHFYEKMKVYFEEAMKAGYFTSKTVVLLPEYLGTWLVISHEKVSVATAEGIQNAMGIIIFSNPMKFLRSLFHQQGEADALEAAVFRMKAEEMAKIYSDTFRDLSRKYRVTINAGSIVLPGSRVVNNEILVDASRSLYNTSFVFRPDGTVASEVVMKSFPISSELPFLKSAPIDALPLFDLPIGKTAILICADSWYPESYSRINELEAEVVLVDSYCAGDGTMDIPWKGYDGNIPGDVDNSDVGKIKEREAWEKYGIPGRLKMTRAQIGVNVFLRGELWDLGTDGQPLFVAQGQLLKASIARRAGIWNFCF